MAVLVVQHVELEGPGRIAHALDRAGLEWTVSRMDLDEPLLTDARELSGIVVMGGPMGIDDTTAHPRLIAERRLLSSAVKHGVPVLGVCLGAQLLAAACHGTVSPGESFELGWLPISSTPEGAADPIMSHLVDGLHVLHWHGDVIDLPKEATLLASSALTSVQAFRIGKNSYGMLFHLEADRAQVAEMAAAFCDDVAMAGLSRTGLVAQTATHEPRVRAAADAAFDAWVSMLRPSTNPAVTL